MKATVGMKIGGSFVLATLFLILFGTVSYQAVDRQVLASERQVHTYEVLSLIDAIYRGLVDTETGQRGFIITGTESYLEPYHAALKTLDTNLEKLRTLTADNPTQVANNASLKPLVSTRLGRLAETLAIRREKGFEAASRRVMDDQGKAAMDAIRVVLEAMSAEESGLLQKRTALLEGEVALTDAVLLGGIVLAVLLLAAVGAWLTLDIPRPLRALTKAAERIALGDLKTPGLLGNRQDEVGTLYRTFDKMASSLQALAQVAERIALGDLTVKVEPLSADDVLGKSFGTMVASLRALTGEVTGAVELVVSSAGEILASTVQVASGISETATAISETTTTVEEVRQAAQLSADKARVVTDGARQVTEVSRTGLEAVGETSKAMEHIRGQMASIAQSIAVLSEQSQSIGQIIASVTGLADQSNLLAVNAAIEAARVGESGRGFVVVAQEIKTLADQSKQATSDVKAILEKISRATSVAVAATEQGIRAAESGVKQALQTGEAIQALAQGLEVSAQSSLQIAASSQQQVVGMNQIGVAMKSINQAGMETSVSMKQSELAAQTLNGLGRKLQALVEKFRR